MKQISATFWSGGVYDDADSFIAQMIERIEEAKRQGFSDLHIETDIEYGYGEDSGHAQLCLSGNRPETSKEQKKRLKDEAYSKECRRKALEALKKEFE